MGPKKTPEQRLPKGRAMIIETSDNEGDNFYPAERATVTKESKDEDANTETKEAIKESPNIRPEWVLLAGCVVAVAVLYMYIQMPSRKELDLLMANLDRIPHGKDFSKDIEKLEKKLDDRYNSLERQIDKNDDLIGGLKEKVAELSGKVGGLIDKFEIHKNDVHGNMESLSNELAVAVRNLREDIESINTTLGNKLDEESRRMSSLEEKLDNTHGKVETTDADVKNLLITLETFRENDKEHDNRIQIVETKVGGYDTIIDEQAKELSERMRAAFATLRDYDDKIQKMKDKVSSNEKDIDTAFDNLFNKNADVKNLLITLETFRENDKEHDNRIQIVETKVGGYDTIIYEQAKELSERMRAAFATLRDYDDKIQKMKDKVSSNEKDIDTAFDNLFNKNVALVVIILILAMNFGLIVAVYTLCQGPTPRVGSRQPHGVRQNDPNGEYYNPVLDQIPVAPTLKKAIGVISFTREYQPGHRHLIRSVTDIMGGGHNIDVEYHVILTDEDITNIPRCSLIVIFVEYSDRDVIIEESGYDLGDCNKTTLAAAQKIGAIPVIVYCKDLSSQRLQPDKLFNERIRCATHQKELIPLSVNNRFFSVYDDFSKNQNTAFQNLITDHVL